MQCNTVCCSVLIHCNALCIKMCCSVLQCVAVCCSVLAPRCRTPYWHCVWGFTSKLGPRCVGCDKTPETGWQRHTGCPIFTGYFSQKSPIIRGSFAERDLQLKGFYASSLPCSMQLTDLELLTPYTNDTIRTPYTNDAILQRGSWQFSGIPDDHMVVWLMTKILFRTFWKTAISVVYKCAANATFSM